MTKRGTYRMARGWMSNPVFREESFCERAAFCWMVEEAAWDDHRRNINGKVIELKRGQFSHSTRFMAAAWRWSEASVRRLLNRLKNDAVIDARTDAGQTLVTLLNYDKYQSALRDDDAADDAELDANLTQRRRSGDADENKTNKTNEMNLFSFGEDRDLAQETFGAVLGYLKANSKKPEPNLRSLLGKWRQQYGDQAVVTAARQAYAGHVTEPISYIIKILGASNGHQPRQKRPGGHRAASAIDAATELAREIK